MIKAIVFDWDKTVKNTFSFSLVAHNWVAKDLHLEPISRSRFTRVWGIPWPDMVRGLWDGVDIIKVKQSLIRYQKTHILPQIRGATKTIHNLAKKYELAVISHSSMFQIKLSAHSNKLDIRVFTKILTAEHLVNHPKPDPRSMIPILQSFEKRHITRKQIVYVGDDTKDFILACRSGVLFLGVLTGIRSSQEFIHMGCPRRSLLKNITKVTPQLLNKRFK